MMIIMKMHNKIINMLLGVKRTKMMMIMIMNKMMMMMNKMNKIQHYYNKNNSINNKQKMMYKKYKNK